MKTHFRKLSCDLPLNTWGSHGLGDESEPIATWQNVFLDDEHAIANRQQSPFQLIRVVVENTKEAAAAVSRIEALEIRVAELESRRPRHEWVTQLVPNSELRLRQPIPITLEFNGDDYVATLMEAGISATGDTRIEAIWNLTDVIVLKYNRLRAIPAENLGPVPTRQLNSLESFIAGD